MQTYSMVILRDLTQKKCIVWVDHFKVTSETNGSKALAKISCLVDEISGMTYVQLLCKRFRDVVMTPWFFAAAFFDRKKLRYQPMNFSMLVYAGKPRVRKDENANYLTNFWVVVSNTPRKFNSLPPKNRQSQKEGLIFQPSFFRGELFNFGGVFFYVHPENWGRWIHFDEYFSDGLVQPPGRFQLPLWSLRV